MTEPRDLRFPTESDDDREIAARLRQSYVVFPEAPADQVTACVAAVRDAVARGDLPIESAPDVIGAPPRLWRPRWWWGAAAAAVLVVVVSRPWRPDSTQQQADSAFAPGAAGSAARGLSSAPVGTTSEERGGATRFDLRLPADADAVSIVGDFNGWDANATPMLQRDATGAWSASVPLPPGRHVYAFVIDGTRWLVDPLAPQVPDAGYGPANAVIVDPR